MEIFHLSYLLNIDARIFGNFIDMAVKLMLAGAPRLALSVRVYSSNRFFIFVPIVLEYTSSPSQDR